MIDIRKLVRAAVANYGKRNLWSVFGYPSTISIDAYWMRYRRGGIASRIIKAYPDACWNGAPIITDETELEEGELSPFTDAWTTFSEQYRVISYLHRVDRLSRVGHFGVLVLGFNDQTRLSQPLAPGAHQLIYLSPYSERSAKVVEWELDATSPRYSLPVMYEIDPRSDNDRRSSTKSTKGSFRIHHTRVIHVAESPDEDESFGEPALRPIWNYLMDLEKVLGSGAETYWLNARGGLSVEAAADAQLSEAAVADMKKQMEEYENELRRTLAMQGAKVSTISTSISDPTSNVTVNLQMISGTTGIPQRILSGSERGELASSEDANSFEARVDERINDHCHPNILQPFVNRMIETGNLPEPEGDWSAEWPEASGMSPAKQAEIASNRITAVSTWANGLADRAVSREEVRTMIGLPPTSPYLDDEEDLDDDEDTLGNDLPDPTEPSEPTDPTEPEDPEDEDDV